MNQELNRRVHALCRTTCLLLIACFAMQAGAVTLLDDSRRVQNFSDDGATTITPDSAFALFNVNNQNSSVDEDSFFGLGSGSGESDFFFSITESIFDITFSVAVATLLDLQGALSGEDGDFGLGEANITLYAGASTDDAVLFSSSGGSGDFVPFNFVDTLDVGTYRLVAQTVITPGGFGTISEWSFTADFTPVPIPAMGWLLAAMLLAMRVGTRAKS